LAVFLCTAAHAQDETPLTDKAAALPPEIETVASGGFWSRNGCDGSYRLVIEVLGWDILYNRVFLQWIRIDPDKQQTIVEGTVPIKEIAGRWRISSHKFEVHKKRTTIVICAERQVPAGHAVFTIVPAADFTYKITSSSPNKEGWFPNRPSRARTMRKHFWTSLARHRCLEDVFHRG
jgi:hypothetical protein